MRAPIISWTSLALGLSLLCHTAPVHAQRCVLTELQKLTASDAGPSAQFGGSVSVSKRFAIIGAWRASGDVGSPGAAYVFRLDNNNTPADPSDDVWSQHAKLLADDGRSDEHFGWSVSVSGNSAIAGARFNPGSIGRAAGAAYVFRLNNNETPSNPDDDFWMQEAKLTAEDAELNDQLGLAVGISGDRAVVGAPNNDDACPEGFFPNCDVRGECPGSCGDCDEETNTCIIGFPECCDSGSAYVFRRDDNGTPGNDSDDFWVQESKLTASDDAVGANFGFSVAIEGDTVVIGAWHDNSAGTQSGSAYVYRKDDNNTPTDPRDDFWVEEEKLVPSDGATFDNFGFAVAVDRDRTVIGSWMDDDDGSLSGSAYVFRRDQNGTSTFRDDDFWVEEDKLTASDAAAGDEFGKSVAIDGSLIAVGSFEDDDACSDDEVFIPTCAEGVACPGSCGFCDPDTFTCRLSLPECCDSGSAYVFRLDDGATPFDPTDDSWFETVKIRASDTKAGDFYGRVGLNGGFLIAGSLDTAPGTSPGSSAGAGYAYYVDGNCTTLENFADFQSCFTDEGGGIPIGCESFNFDGDNDVDLVDLRRLLLTFTGP